MDHGVHGRAWISPCAPWFILLLVLLAPGAVAAQIELTPEALETGITLDTGWRYHPGDDTAWADPALDDSGWTQLEDSSFQTAKLPSSGWPGIGWFRLHVNVGPETAGRPLALRLFHSGASEVYVDGRLTRRFGVVGATRDAEQVYNPEYEPHAIVFAVPGEHVVAIRYSNTVTVDRETLFGRWLAARDVIAGITAELQAYEPAMRRFAERTRFGVGFRVGGICILTTLATLHLLLFAFYREQQANLYYGLFALGLASIIMLAYTRDLSHAGLFGRIVSANTLRLLLPCVMTSFLAFLHTAFQGRVPRYVALGLPLWILTIAAGIAVPGIGTVTGGISTVFTVLVGLDGLWVMYNALRTRQDGARIVAVGVLVFSTVVVRDASNFFVALPEIVHLIVEPLSVLGLALVVSIYLARGVSRTNRVLEAQLAEVRRLAPIEIEHERKSQELEEARQLQLSMLPSSVPELPHLEIAAYMKAATEVGGDYYDFDLAEDGTLTVAIGDATGHGLRAGTMVAATKSLFKAFAREPEIPRIFSLSTRALKQLNLKYLYMGLLVLKVNGRQMRVATAGMPPLLIHRAGTNEIEEVALKGMPLGSVANFPYKEQEVELHPGDTVVLMSDGFPERFNEHGEMLDYAKAREVLSGAAGLAPRDIIDDFVRMGDAWANGTPQNDDVTFVVLRVRDDQG
jgi:serine phosphatase RsbU (regulator of sigma subunit)